MMVLDAVMPPYGVEPVFHQLAAMLVNVERVEANALRWRPSVLRSYI